MSTDFIGESAAIQLLAQSRLHLNAERFRDPANGEICWSQIRARFAFSNSEKLIVGLAESLADGDLGDALTSLDDENWAALIQALEASRARR